MLRHRVGLARLGMRKRSAWSAKVNPQRSKSHALHLDDPTLESNHDCMRAVVRAQLG